LRNILRATIPVAAAGALVFGITAAWAAQNEQGRHEKGETDARLACTTKVARDAKDSALKTKARITVTEALAAAQTSGAGTFGSAKLENENGCVVYSVQRIVTGGKHYEVLIDAGNGRILRQELAGQEHGERESASENEGGEDPNA
jgi:uncharacterized membrane protein YkoI